MFVFINMASSVDGKITSATREPPRFTSRTDRAHMDALRAAADAVLVGGRTLREDDPHLMVRSAAAIARRRSAGLAPQPWTVVLSRMADLPVDRHFFRDDAPRLVVTTLAAAPAAIERLRPACSVWQIGHARVKVATLLQRLEGAGIERLLVEGGGEVAWQFLAANAVDELYVTWAPCLLGGRAAPTAVGGEGWPMAERRQLNLCEARMVGGEIFCRYAVVRPRVQPQGAH